MNIAFPQNVCAKAWRTWFGILAGSHMNFSPGFTHHDALTVGKENTLFLGFIFESLCFPWGLLHKKPYQNPLHSSTFVVALKRDRSTTYKQFYDSVLGQCCTAQNHGSDNLDWWLCLEKNGFFKSDAIGEAHWLCITWQGLTMMLSVCMEEAGLGGSCASCSWWWSSMGFGGSCGIYSCCGPSGFRPCKINIIHHAEGSSRRSE